jgi:hypothetical protein
VKKSQVKGNERCSRYAWGKTKTNCGWTPIMAA